MPAAGPGVPALGRAIAYCAQVDHERFDTDYELTIMTIWAISEFTGEAGATRFVPESHKLGPWQELTQADTLGP